MRRRDLLSLVIGASPSLASLPYNPTRILTTNNGNSAYIFAPASSNQFSLSILDTSGSITASKTLLSTLYSTLPFLSSKAKAFIPLVDADGDITVLAGDCRNSAQGLELWRFTSGTKNETGKWEQSPITLDDTSLSADFLSAGFVYSPTGSSVDSSVYVFGGMCPNDTSLTSSDWTTNSTYSNTMLTIAAGDTANLPLDVSMTGSRAPPIAEAGLSITPLMSASSNSSGNLSVQQNFVLLGGHTQAAFVNMSQIALFTLPEESWAFLGVDQPGTSGNTELAKRSTTVEPRSGHTAVLSENGTQIIVFGGWVGDISNPATPQLAILELGQGYGGEGGWAWSIPAESSNLLKGAAGLYGHAAAMLPGGVMMISGGYSISNSNSKRATQTSNSEYFFYNTTSSSWSQSYINPNSPASPAYTGNVDQSTGPLHTTSQKAGLGVGLGLGLAALIGIILVWFWYSRRLEQKRYVREKELRELALGAERYYTGSMVADRHHQYPEMRTASWGSRQEKRIGDVDDYAWAPEISQQQAEGLRVNRDEDDNGMREAERTGLLLDIPSPTRGLRRSLVGRPHSSYGPAVGGAPSSVFRIDEEDETSQGGSLKRSKTPKAIDARYSDPFKDPPPPIVQDQVDDPAAAERRKEAQGWVEDWRAADASMRFPQHHKPGSNPDSDLSAYQSATNTSSSGRGSPEKSDRTGSNLSEMSVFSTNSIQRSVSGTVSRSFSQRSASAGYALFAGAAAAMSRTSGASPTKTSPNRESYGTVNTGKGALSRSPSKRSTSLNLNSTSSSAKRHGRKRSETFSSARTSVGPIIPGEDQALLSRNPSRAVADEYWATPPESPTREPARYEREHVRHNYEYHRTSSLGSQASRKAMSMLGSVKRVFTGTGQIDVQDRVNAIENATKSNTSSPIRPEMMETPERATSGSASFWKGRQGRADWESPSMTEGSGNTMLGSSSTIRRKPLPGQENRISAASGDIDEDWDPEIAVQNRVVQVMFTVPKEKLRVVNVDALSLLSKSDADFEGGENDEEVREAKRMSSVIEKDEVGAENIGLAVSGDEIFEQEGEEYAKPTREEKWKSVIRESNFTPMKYHFED